MELDIEKMQNVSDTRDNIVCVNFYDETLNSSHTHIGNCV